MKLTVGQKALRVVMFLLGVRNREVARAMRKYGFTDDDLAKGWDRVRALTKGRLDVQPAQDPRLVRELDEWENQWFPIVKVVLDHNFPSVHEHVLRNLAPTSGPEVVMAVTTLVDRLESLGRPESEGGLGRVGKQARDLLSQRGLTESEVAKARALLAQIAQTASGDDEIADDGGDEAEAAMWAWYLEWSAIARHAIKDRKLLKAMGYRQGKNGEAEEPEEPTEPAVEPSPAA